MAASSDSPLCPDWAFLNNSNVHVAKDRGWFKTYTPFTSTLNGLPVLGIGSVEIPTKRSPNRTGVSSHGSVHLKEVLHVPTGICNVIGAPIMSSNGYTVQFSCSPKSNGRITDSEGKNVAYFNPKRPLFTLKVRDYPAGPKLGPHSLEKGKMYWLSCHWDSAEQLKWQEFKAKNSLTNSMSMPADENPPYTADEKAYLKENWRDEYHFLRDFGLNIYKEEDRAEGRQILRVFKNKGASNDEGSGDDDDELSLEGHQADYNFSSSQLDWIEKFYGNSENFMVSYGLKFYDDDDLEEAKAIVDAISASDE